MTPRRARRLPTAALLLALALLAPGAAAQAPRDTVLTLPGGDVVEVSFRYRNLSGMEICAARTGPIREEKQVQAWNDARTPGVSLPTTVRLRGGQLPVCAPHRWTAGDSVRVQLTQQVRDPATGRIRRILLGGFAFPRAAAERRTVVFRWTREGEVDAEAVFRADTPRVRRP